MNAETPVASSNSAAVAESADTEITPPEADQAESPDNPIGQAITACLHRIWDIEFAARAFIPVAAKLLTREAKAIRRQLAEGEDLLSNDQQAVQVLGMKRLEEALERLDRLENSDVPVVLETGLFLSLFSAFDAFTGDLLTALYLKKPELFSRMNRSITAAELLTFDSFDDVKRSILQAEIEAFRRKSYIEQFEELESIFGLKLRAFSRWPDFVECSQRRNLLTHANGTVSDQYLRICEREGCVFTPPVKSGDRLQLGARYFLNACELMTEVVLKLGQTLWRKLLPTELADADAHLHRTIYAMLRARKWTRAQVFGDFAIGLLKVSSEVERRLSVVNYAIALKFGGKAHHATTLLGKFDWSASQNEFKLAEAVLSDRFEDAAAVMHRIGKSGEILDEESYHTWPLFNEFRERQEFLEAYETIYGYPFVAELKRVTDKAREETEHALEKQEHRAIALTGEASTGTVSSPSGLENPSSALSDAI